MRGFWRRRALTLALAVLAAAVLAPAALADAPQVTTNAQKWNYLVGVLLPAGVSLLKRSKWPASLQAVFAFGAACLAAVGTAYWQSTLSWENWQTSALTITIASIASYHGLWKPTGAADKIASLTEPKPTRRKRR